jgi:hypothetical protein
VARKDQVLAHSRDVARNPRNVVIRVDDAPAGMRCCWCDCPDTDIDRGSPHHRPGYVCAGCPVPAVYMVTLGYGRPDHRHFPMCERHQGRAVAMFVRVLKPRVVELPPAWMDADPEVTG